MTNLSTLLALVEAGSGADKELNQACLVALGELLSEPYTGRPTDPNLLTDLNAVIALVEARLPGWSWTVSDPDSEPTAWACLAEPWLVEMPTLYAMTPSPARALLAALLRAEMEKVT